MKKILLSLLVMIILIECSLSQDKNKTQNDFQSLPTLKWKFKTNAPIFSSPVISDLSVYFGSNDSTLYSVNIKSGELNWKFKTKGLIKSSVGIFNNLLFLNGGDGLLYCLDKKSGKPIWSFETEGEKIYPLYGYADYFHSSPVCFGDKVIFGSGDGNIYALNSTNGNLVWKYKTDDVVHANPIVYDNILYLGSFDGSLYSIDIQTGGLIWKFKSVGHRFFPKGEIQGSPTAGNGLIYVGTRDYNLYAIDANKGYCHWNKQFPLGWALAVNYKDTVVYAGTSDDDIMVAFDATSGKELWKTNVKFNIFGPCSFSSSMIYFGTIQGKLFGMDAKAGVVKWIFKTDGYINNHSKYFKDEENIVKNDFYGIVKDPDGYIKALYELGGVFTTPAITDDLIIFTSLDGTVYCLSK